MKKIVQLLPLLTLSLGLFCQKPQLSLIENNPNHKIFKISSTLCKLHIALGNIVEMPVEVIVNAANKELKAGAGVCGAIFEALV